VKFASNPSRTTVLTNSRKVLQLDLAGGCCTTIAASYVGGGDLVGDCCAISTTEVLARKNGKCEDIQWFWARMWIVDCGVSEEERGGDLKRSESDQTQPYLPTLLSEYTAKKLLKPSHILFVRPIDVVWWWSPTRLA
jgi:hypothetical protein